MKVALILSLFVASAISQVILPGGITVEGGVSQTNDVVRHAANVDKLKQHISKLENNNWEIVEVSRSTEQVVAGVRYTFTGSFRNKNDNAVYEATVWLVERPWENFVQLGFDKKKLN